MVDLQFALTLAEEMLPGCEPEIQADKIGGFHLRFKHGRGRWGILIREGHATRTESSLRKELENFKKHGGW